MPQDTEKPVVLLLSLASESCFEKMYSQLLTKLSSSARVQSCKEQAGALAHLTANRPAAVLITDSGILEPANAVVLAMVSEYVKNGGTAVFCCTFSSSTSFNTLDTVFRTNFDLPWSCGDYHRTTFHLNASAASTLPTSSSPSPAAARLEPAYSQKAVHLRDVDPASAVYLAPSGSTVQSWVFGGAPIDHPADTPVAWAPVGSGWVGYVGDVNAEPESNDVILAMCGL